MLLNIKYRTVTAFACGIAAIAATACWYSLRTVPNPAGAIGPQQIISPASIKSDYGNLPLSFELNQGQTDEAVKILARSSGYTLFLTGNEAVFRFQNQNKSNEASALRFSLKYSNPTPKITGLTELPGKTNYFIGDD